MEFEKVVRKRAMIREYEDKPVEEEKLQRILEAAYHAPSAGHTQPQEFVVVKSREQKERLAAAALGQSQITTAPVVIAVVSDTERSASQYGNRGRNFYSVVDGAFSSMLILLSAVNEGLGACFVAAMNDDQVARVLALPEHVRPIGLISIGYPAERPYKTARLPREKITHSEKY